MTRRKLLGCGGLIAAAGAAGMEVFRRGELVERVQFEDQTKSKLNQLLGDELNGRLFTDLSQVSNGVVPIGSFFTRTRASNLLRSVYGWTVRVGAKKFTMGDMGLMSGFRGVHLMECSGNGIGASFGMLGVASWTGVPLAALLDRAGLGQDCRILVSGFDRYSTTAVSSVPGASWVFTRKDIVDSGAFLANGMNGESLTRDHGAPVRLVIPGWYGCACIKWVNEVDGVSDDAPATSQMIEYAGRTHQDGQPRLARDYAPAVIDPAAMPIRVEKWKRDGGEIEYRVVGLVWGGASLSPRLAIRFNPEDPYTPVEHVDTVHGGMQNEYTSWGFWTHTWRPDGRGRYRIRLRTMDESVPARRLNSGFYTRVVEL